MAQLPQAVDYGARPSLRTGRIDRPGTGSQAFADALNTAANTWSAILQKKQEKQDALNYALMRNELITADLLEREKLAEDQDWKTHNERYSAGYMRAREQVAAKYDLHRDDMVMLNAEADLIGARGGVAVRARSRELEVDQGYAGLLAGQDQALHNLLSAKDFSSRDAVIKGQLDAINAARAKGYIDTDAKAEIMRQKLTERFAVAAIEAMDDEEQIELLTGTLAYRKGYGGKKDDSPETTDERVRKLRAEAGLPEYPPGVEPGDLADPYQGDRSGKVSAWGEAVLANGGGSSSGVGPVTVDEVMSGGGGKNIGDYLHADTAAKLLKSALGRDKENRLTIAAQDAFAEGEKLYPEDPDAVLKWVKDNTEGTVEEKASRMARQAQIDQRNADAELQRDLDGKYSQAMRDDPHFRYDDIPVADRELMTESVKRDLKKFEDSLAAKRGGFAEPGQTVWSLTNSKGEEVEGKSWKLWDNMSNEEKLAENLDSAGWKSALEESVWLKLDAEQDEIRNPSGKVTQDSIMTDEQIYTSLMSGGYDGSGAYLPRTKRTEEEDTIWNRELFIFRDRVGQVSAKEFEGGAVPYVRRRQIMLEMMAEKAWVRDASDWDELEKKGWYFFGRDLAKEHAIPAMTMTDSQLKKGFLYHDEFKEVETSWMVGPDDDQTEVFGTWDEYWDNEARNRLKGYKPTVKDKENAHFAMREGMGPAEILRRLGGEGAK